MNTLNIKPLKTQVSETEFVTDGFGVFPALDEVEADAPIYRSRFANKAAIKAICLTGAGEYAGWAVTAAGEEVTDEVGKRNLEVIMNADRFTEIKRIAQDIPEEATQAILEHMKTSGHGLAGGETGPEEEGEADTEG